MAIDIDIDTSLGSSLFPKEVRHSLYGWISLLEVLGKNRTRERKAFFNILAPYHGKNHVVFVKIVLV